MNCEYCKKNFKSKSSLKAHQKNAKFCIKIQKEQTQSNQELKKEITNNQDSPKENNSQIIEIHPESDSPVQKSKICKFCEKVFSEQDDIPEHFEIICKVQLERHRKFFNEVLKQNEFLKNELNFAKDELNKANILNEFHENNNKLRNNKIIENYLHTDIDSIKQVIDDNLKYEHIIGGQEGIARFVFKFLLNNNSNIYSCVNHEKKFFNFLNEQGDMIKDKNAKVLTSLLWQAEIFQKVHKLSVQKFLDMNPRELKFSMVYYEDIKNMEFDNEKFRDCLLTLL